MRLPYTNLARTIYATRKLARRAFVFHRAGQPVSRVFGTDRGTSIDRYWIDQFMATHAHRGTGQAIEVGGVDYLGSYFPNMAPHQLVMVDDGAPSSVVCDLSVGNSELDSRFDVVVATQVFNFIYEVRAALRSTAALLKPGGVLIGSVGAISQISRFDADRWGHYYSFTAQSWERLLSEAFEEVAVRSYGSVDSACAFLHGLCAEEVDRSILDSHDPNYPVLLTFRAVKSLPQ